MLANVVLYSYGTSLLGFTLLTLLVLFTRDKQISGLPAVAATLLTAVWAAIVVVSSLQPYPLLAPMQLAEVARNAAWLFLLLKLINSRLAGTEHFFASTKWLPWFCVGCVLVVAGVFGPLVLTGALPQMENSFYSVHFATWLAMAILGLLLLEQIYRNSTQQERWSVKHLCLGLGVIYAYDFFMYAEALLFRQLNGNLWQARGFVTGLTAVLIAVAISRMERPQTESKLYLSRHVVFHTVTLIAAGVYLLLMALAGYFIQYMGGAWGGVIQITFLVTSGLLLLVLLFSGQMRARLRVWLSKNFFSYKYDYRLEWLQFTRTLASGDDNVPVNIIYAMGNLTKSPGGLLWSRTEDGRFTLEADWEMAVPEKPDELRDLPQWLEQSEWIVDLKEWRQSPDLYDGLDMPPMINKISRAWLIVPLMFGDILQGILLQRESDLQPELNWEDRDLLKVAGRQAASHLAQYQANQALVNSRQFEAFNRLSAYVIHDLKNILAQQSLIVSNAGKHRDNPEFVDDVINTVENSVERMTRLMNQMRSGVRGGERQSIELGALLRETINERANTPPQPVLRVCADNVVVFADRAQLGTVFNHIIQNAQEAAGKTGQVTVELECADNRAIVWIEDNGVGMDEEFLQNRLFKPFESTKGLTGMGIGAFESREFIRALGGDIRVSSTPGVGSRFAVEMPVVPVEKTTVTRTGTGQ